MSNKRARYQVDGEPSNAAASSSRSRLEDEEAELEAQLFGKKRVLGGSTTTRVPEHDDEVDSEDESDDEMAGMEDQDLFVLDDVPGMSGFMADEPSGSDEEHSEASDSDEDAREPLDGAESDSSDNSATSSSRTLPTNPFARPASSARKKSLWHDPADEQVTVRLSEDKRLRKLARGKEGEESDVRGKELEKKLRSQFEKLHPAPSWTSKPAKKTQTASSLSGLLQSTAPLLAKPKRRGPLPSGSVSMTRLRDANFQSKVEGMREVEGGKGGITWVGFHPRVSSALAVVGGDRRLRIFNVDGHTNPSLLTLHIPSLPISNAMYHPSGSSLLLTGQKAFYYTYDLATQRCLRSPPALFGLTKATTSATSPRSTEKSAFSPDGSVLAVAGRRGVITLVEWAPGGAGQLIGTINSGRTSGIQDLIFMNGGSQLWVLGEGSEVDVWDLGSRRCLSRWRDEGGFGGASLVCSRDREYMAVGSTSGFINVYDTNSIVSSMTTADATSELLTCAPKPIRTLENLTTTPSVINFNHDSQMMVTASAKKKDALKVYHLPSATAFKNWPTAGTPLGVVTAADFSAYGEYLAIGNQRGKVLLYSVNHYRDA